MSFRLMPIRATHVLGALFPLVLAITPAHADTAAERLTTSADVLKEIMDTPDQSIPESLLDGAYCVVIVPGVQTESVGALRRPFERREAVTDFKSEDLRRTWSCW
jgi:hypothetical protein